MTLTQQIALPYPLDLRLCRDKDIPSPKDNFKNIFLFIENMEDGIGDFVHGLSFAKELQEILKDKGYQICAVIHTKKIEDDPNHPFSKRASYVRDVLASGKHHFDKWYHIDVDINDTTYYEWLQKNEETLQNELNHAAMALQISYGFSHTDLWKDLPRQKEQVIACGQYGTDSHHREPHTPNILTEAAMGLPKEGAGGYGIKLYPSEVNQDNRAARLLAINAENRNPQFIKHLLGKTHPTNADAEHYFSSHHFIPGYIQNKASAEIFILTQVLKHADEQRRLNKSCDIMLPKDVIDEETIRSLLKHYGFHEDDIAFINKDTPDTNHTSAKIRIMSFYIKEEEDYNALYQMTGDGTGCSGDNSISLAFSNRSLPYYQDKPDDVIGRFYEAQLLYTLNQEIQQSDSVHKDALISLKDYFEHLLLHKSLDRNKDLYMVMTWENGHYPIAWERDMIQKSSELFNWCEKAAQLAKAAETHNGWKVFQKILFEKYNYRQNFVDIVKTALYLSRPDADVYAILQESAQIQMLMKAGVFDQKTLRDYSVDDLILFTASEPIIQGLIKGIITPLEMKKHFAGIHPYNIEDELKIYQSKLQQQIEKDQTVEPKKAKGADAQRKQLTFSSESGKENRNPHQSADGDASSQPDLSTQKPKPSLPK